MEIEELKREFSQQRDGTKFHYKFEMECEFNGCMCYVYKVRTDWGAKYYEGFKRTVINKCVFENGKMKKTENLKEKYPRDNDFGTWAWTSPNLQSLLRTLESKCTR